MSSRAERRRQKLHGSAPPRRTGLIAGIIALLVVAAIVAYAIINAKRVVPGAAVAPNAVPSFAPPALAGTRAPSFEVQTPQGPIGSASLAGTPYLLEIFATWCPHCRRETSVLRRVRVRYPESKLAIVSITGSPVAQGSTPDNLIPETQADVDRFDQTYGVTWPGAYDPNLSVVKAWGFGGFPQIFVVNRAGVIVYAHNGEASENELSHAIERALRR